VHVLGTDGAGIDPLQLLDDLAQGTTGLAHQGAGIKDLFEVRLAQAMEGGIEIGHRGALADAQGVQVGLLMAAYPVGVDELQDLRLHARRRCRACGGRGRGRARRRGYRLAGREFVEIGAPLGIERARILQPGLVAVFQVGGIGALQNGTFGNQLANGIHDSIPFTCW
jgi:hypothetical protein